MVPGSARAAQDFSPLKDERELREQILASDSVIFDKGFNECDVEALRGILHPDATMVHDQSGMSAGKEQFIEPIQETICGDGPQKPIRKLQEHTTEIFPLFDDGALYGALQTGRHEFYLREADKPLRLTNRARFSTLWILEDSGWKIKTAYFWDHLNPNENGPFDADVLVAGFDRRDDTDYMLKAHDVTALSVAFLQNGVVSEVATYGNLDAERPAPMDTIFNTASLAKPVSSMVALRLADAGLLDLDAPLSAFHLDEDIAASPYADQVTARHVLTHTSGLPKWRYLDPENDSKLRFLSEPCAEYRYSGEGFEWLRQAIETKLDRSLEDLAIEHVFGPAGMRDTSYLFPEDKAGRVATRFGASNKEVQADRHTVANAAANLMTTASDYGHFLKFVMDGGGLSGELRSKMLGKQIAIEGGSWFGLGWQIFPGLSDNGIVIQHSGFDPGVRSLAIGWPGTGNGLIILSNDDDALPIMGKILEEKFGSDGIDILERYKPE